MPRSGDEFDAEDIEKRPPRDVKRTALIVGLGALSWVATYVGMLELIEANMGDLPFIHKIIIGFSVAMLMTMIVWLLDQMFKPLPFVTKFSYALGYIFLSIISIGFGFGFYWKVLESRGEASRSAESAVTQVQSSLQGASTRLEQLQATLAQLTTVSAAKAELEQTRGTSCPNSRPGDGPRRKLREQDAQQFSFASDFVRGRVDAVKTDLAALDTDLAKIGTADPSTFDPKTGTRNEFMKNLGRKLDLTSSTYNALRSDPQLTQIRSELAGRAERTTFDDGRGKTFSCPDGQLQSALRGVVKAIDQLPTLETPKITAVEGSEATIEAFRRLTATFYGALSFKLPPSADELRELQKKAIQSVENPDQRPVVIDPEQAGLSKRDYVPLAVAIFVDLCLLLVSMVTRPTDRLGSLVPKMKAAERGPVIQILSRFNEIHRDRQIRENFEIFRHVVFDLNGDYYVAVPLDAPQRLNPDQREALRVEAQLLSNLFASFEKEKIFKRTLLPTNKSIRKRLARQGSKFAGSEAFRVYKFADGAWSDIILGAVMGAAKRIEAEQRTRRMQYAEQLHTFEAAARTQMPEPVARVLADQLNTSDASLSINPAAKTSQDALDAQFGVYASRRRVELTKTPPPSPLSPQLRRAAARADVSPPPAEVTIRNGAAGESFAPPFAGDPANDDSISQPSPLLSERLARLSAADQLNDETTIDPTTETRPSETTGLQPADLKSVDEEEAATSAPLPASTVDHVHAAAKVESVDMLSINPLGRGEQTDTNDAEHRHAFQIAQRFAPAAE